MDRTTHPATANVGGVVKELLEGAGLSQRAAAEQALIPYATFHRLLNGAETVQLPHLERIATVLGTTPEALIAAARKKGGEAA